MQWITKTSTLFPTIGAAATAFQEVVGTGDGATAASMLGCVDVVFDSATLRPLTTEEKALDNVYGGNAFCIEVVYTGEKA
jgi:hypothetical protein